MPDSDVIETASWIRRMFALAVDWAACSLVTIVLVGGERFFADAASSPDTLPSFITLGSTSSRTASSPPPSAARSASSPPGCASYASMAGGSSVSLLAALGRSVLIAAVIPPLVFRSNGRGLHDILFDTATVTLQTAKGSTAS